MRCAPRLTVRRICSCIISAMFVYSAGCHALPNDSNSKQKFAQIRKRAELGYTEQQIELAAAYLTGRGMPQSFPLAARWYEKAAAAGNPEAENQIGYFYQYGI